MSGHFFARFNLQNAVGNFPASATLLSAFSGESPEQSQSYLDTFQQIQDDRVNRLRQKFGKEIETLRHKTVLFLGDSITSDNLGYRASVSDAADLISYDGSVSGGTSSTVLHSAKIIIESIRPDFVSIMIGSNDSVSIERESLHQVSIEEYRRNVNTILEWATNCGSKILLFEIPPICEPDFIKSFHKQGKLQSNQTIQEYNGVLKDLAKQYGIPLISHDRLRKDVHLENDGIHLNMDGQEQIAEQWLVSASERLKKH